MIPIVLAGNRHRSDALAKLTPVLSRWFAQWCISAGQEARLEVAEAEAGAGEWRLASAKGTVSLAPASGNWADIVFGSSAELIPDDEVSQQLQQQACHALLKELAANLGAEGEIEAVGHQPRAAVRAGRVVLAARLNNSLIHIVVDASLLGVKTAASKQPLASRQSAVTEALVSLKVELPLARVAIDDFIGLKPGDIICSQTPLSSPFLVSVGENRLPVSASLGASDSHKAVKLHARPLEK